MKLCKCLKKMSTEQKIPHESGKKKISVATRMIQYQQSFCNLYCTGLS